MYRSLFCCTCEDTVAHNLGASFIDDVMSFKSLTTLSLFLSLKPHLPFQFTHYAVLETGFKPVLFSPSRVAKTMGSLVLSSWVRMETLHSILLNLEPDFW